MQKGDQVVVLRTGAVKEVHEVALDQHGTATDVLVRSDGQSTSGVMWLSMESVRPADESLFATEQEQLEETRMVNRARAYAEATLLAIGFNEEVVGAILDQEQLMSAASFAQLVRANLGTDEGAL